MQLKYLEKEEFKDVRHLNRIKLDGNQLSVVIDNLFEMQKNLEYLGTYSRHVIDKYNFVGIKSETNRKDKRMAKNQNDPGIISHMMEQQEHSDRKEAHLLLYSILFDSPTFTLSQTYCCLVSILAKLICGCRGLCFCVCVRLFCVFSLGLFFSSLRIVVRWFTHPNFLLPILCARICLVVRVLKKCDVGVSVCVGV